VYESVLEMTRDSGKNDQSSGLFSDHDITCHDKRKFKTRSGVSSNCHLPLIGQNFATRSLSEIDFDSRFGGLRVFSWEIHGMVVDRGPKACRIAA